MSISRLKPSNELASLKDGLGRLIADRVLGALAIPSLLTGTGVILLDVYEEGNNLIIKASLPGIKPQDLNIEVRENVLIISGQTKRKTERKGEDYLINERRSGQFRRSVPLPYDIEVDKVEAEFEDGTLTLTLPKAKTTKGKMISVTPKAKAEAPKAKAQKPKAKAQKPKAKAQKQVLPLVS